jgi:glutamate:GABA antiporter
MPKELERNKPTLGVLPLVMMNIAIIFSLRGLPIMAKEGWALIFFIVLAAIIYFIPTALIVGELTTTWTKANGVYDWTRKGIGPFGGFLAIWFQWLQNLFWYPTVLSFAAATFAYVLGIPELITNKLYMILVIIGVYWLATIVNLRGLRFSGWFTTACIIIGTLLPVLIIIILGIIWLVMTQHPHLHFHASELLPNFKHIDTLAFFSGVILLMFGIEVNAVHSHNIINPQRTYPKAILYSTTLIITLFILGSLAVALVVSPKNIDLVAGLMQAFSSMLITLHVEWLRPIIALMVVIGTLGQVVSWVIGPCRGLFVCALDGDLPPWMAHENRHGVPIHLLIMQGIIISLLSFVFLLMPTVSSSFWILTVLTVLMYAMMYIMLYIAAIQLRRRFPEKRGTFQISRSNTGLWIATGLATFGVLLCIAMGFIPPSQLHIGKVWVFELLLASGVFLAFISAIIIFSLRKPSWKKVYEEDK